MSCHNKSGESRVRVILNIGIKASSES